MKLAGERTADQQGGGQGGPNQVVTVEWAICPVTEELADGLDPLLLP